MKRACTVHDSTRQNNPLELGLMNQRVWLRPSFAKEKSFLIHLPFPLLGASVCVSLLQLVADRCIHGSRFQLAKVHKNHKVHFANLIKLLSTNFCHWSKSSYRLMSDNDNETSFATALVAGGFAGTSVDVALFPIDTLKTRMQSPQGFVKAGGFRDQ